MKRVGDLLTWKVCGQMAGKTPRNVRYWSEAGTLSSPPVALALAYDAAYQAAGGEGAPFRDAYTFQFKEITTRRAACQRELADAIAEVARESGEAIAASIALTQSNASPLLTLRASAEVGQLRAACTRLARLLVPFFPAGAGSVAGIAGGTHD
ncbi:hypothetical protein U1763_10360 [Sphingomonas sp. LB2R24]